MTDTEALGILDAAFGPCPRPEHFTNDKHCEECAEHDELLRNRDRDTLTVADVGNPSWDPICFITGEGLNYHFPTLARLALADPADGHGWYFEQLLFHLNDRDTPQKRRPGCTPEQRRAVVSFLVHVQDTRDALLPGYFCENELGNTIARWASPTVEPDASESARRLP